MKVVDLPADRWASLSLDRFPLAGHRRPSGHTCTAAGHAPGAAEAPAVGLARDLCHGTK